jgi:trehalose 6-phosphate synthase
MLAQLNPAVRPDCPTREEPERLIVVSNRGPVQHHLGATGRLTRTEAGGGVATALGACARFSAITWLAAPASNADRMLAIADRAVPLGADSRLRYVDVPEEAQRLFYEVFANPVLWFIQHGLEARLERDPNSAEVWRAWEHGYRRVNEIFASAIIRQVDEEAADRVMLHDYHFYLAPRIVRALRPHVTIQHFVHIPWPAPHSWSALPAKMVTTICRGLLGNDSLTFQTDESVENFLATCAIYLREEADVDAAAGEVKYGRHTTTVWSNPISVDAQSLRREVASEEARPYREAFQPRRGERLIVRVDRLDPSKDVASGFRAFEGLLEAHPEWQGRVRFLAFLVPSRTSIREYKAYEAETLASARRVNDRFGREDWQPVEVYHEHNRLQALVALSRYDVLLVNSLADGMNLVSKEGAVLNERDGVLVLSDGAGSHEELRCGAISVRRGDEASVAEGLDAALRMSAGERRERAAALRECVERHQLQDWMRLQLKDLAITEYVKGLSRPAYAL